MTAVLVFLRRYGGFIVGGMAVIALLIWIDHRGYARAADAYQARIDRLQSQIAAKTAEAANEDMRHARDIEQARGQITNEVSNAYQKRLAGLRARYDSLRAAPENPAGCGAGTDLPSLPDPAGGPDAAAAPDRLPCPTALIATEQAMQLEALQAWLREQQAVAE